MKGSRAALDLAKKHSDKTAFYLSNFKSGLVSSNGINVNRFKASSNKSSEDCCSGNMPRSSNYTSSGSLSESATVRSEMVGFIGVPKCEEKYRIFEN